MPNVAIWCSFCKAKQQAGNVTMDDGMVLPACDECGTLINEAPERMNHPRESWPYILLDTQGTLW